MPVYLTGKQKQRTQRERERGERGIELLRRVAEEEEGGKKIVDGSTTAPPPKKKQTTKQTKTNPKKRNLARRHADKQLLFGDVGSEPELRLRWQPLLLSRGDKVVLQQFLDD
jgi:hypothetical protein